MIRNLLALAACVAALLACASQPAGYFPPEALPPPDLLSGAPIVLTQQRVVIQFKQVVAYDDIAFVQTLQDPCHVLLHHAAAVSANTHAYTMELPADRDAAATLQCLRGLASVGRVEIDGIAKAQ